VTTNVIHQLLAEIIDGSKDASTDHVAFNLGKPVLDLIEPGRIRRSVVDLYFGMGLEEIANPLCLVSRKIVGNETHQARTSRLLSNQIVRWSSAFVHMPDVRY
jgi:hypothetical protein